MAKKEVESAFDTMELPTATNTNTRVKNVIVPDENVPDITDIGWNDYVMGLFDESELIDGRPLVAGLRRIVQLVFGPIAESLPVQVFPPKDDNHIGRATVVWRLVLGDGRVFGDVADAWEGNTDDMFCVHSVATAGTRAEARALRKALQLRTVAAEEMTNKNAADTIRKTSKPVAASEGEYDEQSRITDAQAKFIDIKAKQVNVNVADLFEKVFNSPVSRKISKQVASSAIDKLNEYQQAPTTIPEEVKGYVANWK